MGGGLQAKPERAGDLLVVRELRHHHRCGAVLLGSSLPVNSIAATAVPGFNFSVEFRRNVGVFFVFASYREE